jgi:hypothetical protein
MNGLPCGLSAGAVKAVHLITLRVTSATPDNPAHPPIAAGKYSTIRQPSRATPQGPACTLFFARHPLFIVFVISGTTIDFTVGLGFGFGSVYTSVLADAA